MMLKRIGMSALLLALAAPAMAQTVADVVAAAQADVGRDLGGGLTLLAAQQTDNALQYAFEFAATAEQIAALGAENFADGFMRDFMGGQCAIPAVAPFVAAGGVVEVTMLDPAGASIFARRVTSC
jgi:hypothetical protein